MDAPDSTTTVEPINSEEERRDERRRYLIDGLRQLADVIEADGDERALPIDRYDQVKLDLFSAEYDAGVLARAAKALGEVKKSAWGEWFNVTKEINPAVKLEVSGGRDKVCTQVTKTKPVEREIPVDREQANQIQGEIDRLTREAEALPKHTVTVEEEVTEWECPPSLLEKAS